MRVGKKSDTVFEIAQLSTRVWYCGDASLNGKRWNSESRELGVGGDGLMGAVRKQLSTSPVKCVIGVSIIIRE